MVERYNPLYENWGRIPMEPDATGDWVRHSDYADLERQIAELRAERDRFSELYGREAHAHMVSREAAEIAQLRALPLKDEVERVLEPFAKTVENAETAAAHYDADQRAQVPDTQLYGPLGVRWGDLRAARNLLSRLRAGEKEGWRLPEGTLAVHGKDVVIAYDDFKDARRAFNLLENVIGAAPSEQGGDRG